MAKELKFAIGDKVKMSGLLYGNGHGTGSAIEKVDVTMYVVGLANPDRYEYPIALANTPDGRRQGWTDQGSLKKIGEVRPGTPSGEVKAKTKPTSGQSTLIGKYAAAFNVYLRGKAGSHGEKLAVVPMGHQVKCALGEYTPFAGTKWLYVETVLNGVKYTGFCSGSYLLRV